MAKLRHDTSDFTNLDVAGLASTLQSLLLPQVPASAHRLRLLANKLEHVATCLRDQAESMQLQPVAALEQRQSDTGAEGYAANPQSFSASGHTAAQSQSGTSQLPAAASMMHAEQPQHLSGPGPQHDFDTHSAQLAAPQIITAEGQSRRSKRKLGAYLHSTYALC